VVEDDLKQEARRLAPQLVAWRRSLHRHPELAFEEERTAALAADTLRRLGMEVRTGIARTGVVGILRAEPAAGPAVLLRADMDALPIQEVAGREYGSAIPGKMHACGHDGHTAMLLGAATLLAARRDRLPQDVVFCFQPAEEGRGGGRRMVEEGLLDLTPTAAAYGLHLWSYFPVGTVHVRSGPTMAAQDEFTAIVRGKGGHGALPHRAADPLLAAAQAVVALQAIVSRSVDPVQPAVVSVGALHAGHAPNAIPDHARLDGTLRSFNGGVRELLRRRVREVLEGVASAAGCTVELDLRPGYPAVVNDPEATDRVRLAARATVGEANILEPEPTAAAEDFAYYLQKLPGAFVFVGAGNAAKGITAPHHSADFDLDEDALPIGAELLARIALAP
jgi:amidohydrolase